jgi:hypothetical protein
MTSRFISVRRRCRRMTGAARALDGGSTPISDKEAVRAARFAIGNAARFVIAMPLVCTGGGVHRLEEAR